MAKAGTPGRAAYNNLRMRDVAVIGAGELGGACAHLLARRQAARAVRLVDDTGHVAAGKALDIAEAAPVEAFATAVSGSADLAAAAGVDVLVIADRAAGGDWTEEELLPILERLARAAPHAAVVVAGSAGRGIVERAVRERRLARARVIGTAPEALAAAVRAVVALEADCSPRDVSLTLLGVPPAHIVVPWGEATVHGLSVEQALDEPARRRIAARLPALWPPGPYALASATALAVDALAGRTRRRMSVFLAPDDSLGRKARAAAVPVKLGTAGATPVDVTLNVRDQVAFDNARLY